MRDRKYLESYIPLCQFIAALCGPRCEVALHSLDDVNHSIVAIFNGHVTGRKPGDGLMDYALETVLSEVHGGKNYIANYGGKSTKDGKILRFSTYYVRRPSDNAVVGLLNVNTDITDIARIKEFADNELYTAGGALFQPPYSAPGGFALSAGDMVDAFFREALEQIGKTDAAHLSRDDKMKVIAAFNKRNMFAMKGVVSYTAQKLNLSEPSVYRYLKGLKNTGGE